MALHLSKELNNGVEVSYWKIDSYSLNVTEGRLLISIGIYMNKTARDTGKRPVKTIDILMDSSSKDVLMTDAYNHLKTLPEFAGSSDV